jgi:hypothetical protein
MAKLSKELWFYVIGWMLRVGSLGICNLYSGWRVERVMLTVDRCRTFGIVRR